MTSQDRHPFKPVRTMRGFSLVELSIVVVIMGILLTLGLGALNSQLLSSNYTETKRKESLIKEALIAYLGANRRLPCPDVPNRTNDASDSSGVTGNEDRTGGVVTGVCSGNIGVVPYTVLGISRDAAIDGWGNFISYSVSSNGANCGTAPTTIDWTLTACYGAGKAGVFTLNEGFVGSATEHTTNGIAMAASAGPNGLGAWARQGTRNADPVTCEEAHNTIQTISGCTLTALSFFKGERPEVDDVVSLLTRDEAINSLSKQGILKTADGQVVDDLARLRTEKLYETSGSCSISPVADRDPWGNPYQVFTQTGVAFCVCTNRGSGAAYVPDTCAQSSSITCTTISTSEVNVLRTQRGFTAPTYTPC